MKQSGHHGVSLLLYAPVGFALVVLGHPGYGVFGGVVVFLLATVPDVDNRIPGLTHRGVTHTVGFALAVGATFAGGVLLLAQQAASPLPADSLVASTAFAFGVGTFGILAHLAADALTPAGVPLFWPLSKERYSLYVTTADSAVWNYGLFLLGVVASAGLAILAFRLA